MKQSPRKSMPPASKTSPRRPGFGVQATTLAQKRTSTPNPPAREGTPDSISLTPSKLTGLAKDSVLTKQADKTLKDLEITLQTHIEQLTGKLDQMTTRLSHLDELMEDLMKDDLDQPQLPTSTEDVESSALESEEDLDPTTPRASLDHGTSLLDENAIF